MFVIQSNAFLAYEVLSIQNPGSSSASKVGSRLGEYFTNKEISPEVSYPGLGSSVQLKSTRCQTPGQTNTRQGKKMSLCFPDVNVICECTFPWIERRHQIGINTEKPVRMLRGSSLQGPSNEKLIHKKNPWANPKTILPETTTLHLQRFDSLGT